LPLILHVGYGWLALGMLLLGLNGLPTYIRWLKYTTLIRSPYYEVVANPA